MSTDDGTHDKPTVRPTAPPRRSAPTRQEAREHISRPAPDESHIGATLGGRYRVLSKLGQGGMGVVYLAEHVMIEKKVAVKVLSGDFARKPDLVARFAQEARAASRIGHENIIDITDFGETPSGSAYFVMEYLEGRDLGRHVRESAPMPLMRVARIFSQMCRALSAAHAKGIIHRDLKPENIFLVDGREQPDFVKVLDFGLARVSALTESERLTQTGMIFGTPEYMSPEQARGETADHRTDVYAAGCILYEMLTGDVPFHAPSFMAILRRQIEDSPDPPSKRAPALVTPALDVVVLKALAKDREERYATMKELALALAEAAGVDAKTNWTPQEDAPPLPIRPTPREPSIAPPSHVDRPTVPSVAPHVPRNNGARWAIALSAIALAGLAAWVLWPRPAAAPVDPAPVVAAPLVAPPVVAPPVTGPPAPVAHPSRVSIISTPPGADVMHGNERLGRTPLELSFSADTTPFDVTLTLKGWKDQPLHIAPDHDRDYVVQLTAARAHSPTVKPKTPPSVQPTAPSHKGPAELKDVLSD